MSLQIDQYKPSLDMFLWKIRILHLNKCLPASLRFTLFASKIKLVAHWYSFLILFFHIFCFEICICVYVYVCYISRFWHNILVYPHFSQLIIHHSICVCIFRISSYFSLFVKLNLLIAIMTTWQSGEKSLRFDRINRVLQGT